MQNCPPHSAPQFEALEQQTRRNRSNKAQGALEQRALEPTIGLIAAENLPRAAEWAQCNKSQARRGRRRLSAAPLDKKHSISNMVARNYSRARPMLAPLAGPLGALAILLATLLLLGLQGAATADQSNYNAQQQDQSVAPSGVPAAAAQAASAAAAALSESLATSASSNNYQSAEAQHQGGQQASKSKKIQIVYIKVPLAKLRPSLANNGHQGASNSSSGSDYSETTHFNSQGSHSQQQQFSAADEQQLMGVHELTSDNRQRGSTEKRESSRQPQSFLIPMALVQSSTNDQPHQQQPQQQQLNPSQTISGELPRQPSPVSHHMRYERGPFGMGHAGSQLHAAHMKPWLQPHNFLPAPFWSNPLTAAASDGSERFQSHQGNRQQVGPTHGFMSSFLLGEKEKMTQAALRLQRQQHQQQQQQTRFNQSAGAQAGQQYGSLTSPPPQQTASTQLFASSSNVSPQPPQQTSPPTSTSLDPKGPGGLMPSMIAPLSRMPDNAIGQAYGAAVGMALPVESGSPTNLLSSSSTNSNYGQAAQPQQARGAPAQVDSSSLAKPHGGNSGTNGAGAYSSGTGSSTSYGASGPGPHASSSSAMASPILSHAFDATAHSSGYGSGTSTSGVSAALSDYPAAQSTSSPYNHQSNQPAARVPASSPTSGAVEEMQLKQAKKTIIPIVVQVEHALLGNNNEASAYQQQQQQQQPRGNRYGGNRSLRQLGGKRGRQNGNKNASNQLYGLATNEIAQYGDIPPGAQWINAANSYDINQITAQINAENAASAAAALAQADAAFAQGAAGYSPSPAGSVQHHQQAAPRPMQHQGRPGANQNAANAYAAGLQSAASALLANTHPMIQAAASGGLASVSKLGAKLGEMIALPSMQVPGSMASIGQSLPSALSSLTNQMGVQLGQAVQQAAKDHPTATAFARQVAQQAGIQLPNYVQQQQANHQHHHPQQQQQHLAAASSQHVAQMQSPQSQLQNLKLGLGHSLQSAASSLIGLNQKANAASSLLPQSPSSALNQVALTAALKQLSAISPTAAQLAGQLAGLQSAASSQQQTVVAPPQSSASSEQDSSASALQPNQQQLSILNQFLQQQQQVYRQLANLQQASGESSLDSTSQLESTAAKPAKASSSFKSKFLSFFQAPKFITNLIGWNDRADSRNDQGEPIELAANLTTTTSLAPNATSSQAASSPMPTTEARTSLGTTASASSTTSGQQTSASSAATTSATANATHAATSSTAKMPETTRPSTASSPAPTTNATSAPPKSATTGK